MDRVAVWVSARDPISEAGVVSALRPRPEVRVVPAEEAPNAQVAVVIADSVDDDALRLVRMVRRQSAAQAVLVAGRLEDGDVVTAVEAGVLGLVRRAEATPDRLVRVICGAATGEGSVPPDLLGRLLDQVGTLQRQVLRPRGLTFTGLASREIEVLRLVADGYDTSEIAQHLAYSERTVKNVLHDVTTRLQLRNRSHAVAYALREGLI
ncbi:response regulator transcription factor [Cellulomonas sp. H30R-01]|uniref:Helix-turn-helix transcriptional regulator n=1 Tax=Cellulomonas algicola TaxID=2071633 RepID=A0A401UV33_9CELL|nr:MULTISPECIES: response regulator transcription factor [Cellulomonas]QHT57656.1 response regulator transcription factor [Cellulomonas sp. H30R-01]GCD18527.1 helix-turn-helix transcriptional regulator [Cellulomonas algicola]